MTSRARALGVAAVWTALVVLPGTPASADNNTVTSCTITHFNNPELGSDYGEITYTKPNGDTRTKRMSPERASREAAEDGVSCIFETVQ